MNQSSFHACLKSLLQWPRDRRRGWRSEAALRHLEQHRQHRLQAKLPDGDGYSQIFRSYVFCPWGFWTVDPLRYTAKFDPLLSLDCARVEGAGSQSKERKGSNFAV